MPTYEVGVAFRVFFNKSVLVEAGSREAARAKVEAMIEAGAIAEPGDDDDWHLMEGYFTDSNKWDIWGAEEPYPKEESDLKAIFGEEGR